MPLDTQSSIPVLVITDSFPVPDRSDTDLHLSQILQTLRDLGHPVTLIARDDRDCQGRECLASLLNSRFANPASNVAAGMRGSSVRQRAIRFL